MANPRKTVDFTGIHQDFTTYLSDGVTITYSATVANGNAAVGRAVGQGGADGTVALANDGDSVFGRLELVENDGVCVVQDEGYCTLPGGAAAAVTRGQKIVGALDGGGNRGFVRALAAAPAMYSQTFTQDMANARHRIISNGDTTALVVKLD